MRLIDADELCNGLLDRWKTADENNEELIKHLMADGVTPIVVSTPTVEVLDKIKAEIEQTADEEQKHDEKWAIGLRYAVKIIDNFMEDKE